jgi:hypothetical protein
MTSYRKTFGILVVLSVSFTSLYIYVNGTVFSRKGSRVSRRATINPEYPNNKDYGENVDASRNKVKAAFKSITKDALTRRLNNENEGGLSEDIDLAVTDEMEEEKAEREEAAVRADKIASIFWEKAPDVFEHMIEEGKRDISYQDYVTEEVEKTFKELGLFETELLDVDCSEILCKAQLVHQSEPSAYEFQRVGIDVKVWQSSISFGTRPEWNDANSGFTTNMYFGRPRDKNIMVEIEERMAALLEQEREG